jgi:mitochondrial fission protein ELM1
MSDALEIRILSDGKPGHENQSFGLAEAIGRRRPVRISKIELGGAGGAFSRLRAAWRAGSALPAADLLIGAGHATHPALLGLACRSGAPCVLLMKPTLPMAFFDLCLVPAHDLGAGKTGDRVVPTLGALNRVPPPGDGPRHGGLILVGGPSAAHGWDPEALHKAVQAIVSAGKDRRWRATDSRRSPAGSMEALAAACPALAIYPHGGTGRDWLPQRLAEAAEVWVTEDSVSMIYEALSSGARVGLLPVPALKKSGRVTRGIERLVAEGFVTRFADWSPHARLAPPPRILREADRCADLVIERLLPA